MKHPADALDPAKCAEILSVCSCLQLRKATRLITQLYDKALRPSGLRSTQLPILVTLAVIGPTSMMFLAERLVTDRSALARNLKPLEKQGMIEIMPGGDRRTRQVKLTPRGEETVARATPLWEKAQSTVVEALGQNQWHVLREGLSAVLSLR